MASDRLKIIFSVVSDDKNLKKELKDSQKSVENLDKTVDGLNRSFKIVSATVSKIRTPLGSIKGAVGGLGSAFGKVLDSVFSIQSALVAIGAGLAIRAAVREAQALENALIGLRSVAISTGNDVDTITEAAKELSADGLIPLSQVSNSLKNLLATGLDAGKAVEVFKALRDSAAFNRQGQLELGEAIEGAAEGLKNDLSIKIDNAGITKNLSNIMKEYAATVGKSVNDLTDAERAQAKYVGITKEAGIFQGDYNKLLDTFSGAQSKVTGNFRFLLAEIGELITKNPVVIKLTRNFADALGNLRVFIRQNRVELRELVSNSIKLAIEGFSALGSVIIDVIAAGLRLAQQYKSFINEGAIKQLELDIKALEDANLAFIDTITESGAVAKKESQAYTILKNSLAELKGENVEFNEQLEKTKASFDKIKAGVKDAFSELLNTDGPTATVKVKTDDIETRVRAEVEPVLKKGAGSILSGEFTKFFDSVSSSLSELRKLDIGLPSKAVSGIMLIGRSFGETISTIEKSIRRLPEKTKKEFGVALGNVLGSALRGKEGAKKLVAGAASALATAFGGPIAGAITEQVIGPLMEGPEAVRSMIREFAQAIPELVENIAESLPVVIEELADAFPVIIERIAEKADVIILALSEAMVKISPFIALAIARAIPGAILGSGKALISALSEVLTKAGQGFGSELVKRLLDGVGDFLKKLISGASEIATRMIYGAASFTKRIVEGAISFTQKIVEGAGQFVRELLSKIPGVGNILGGSDGGILGGAAGSVLGGVIAGPIGSVLGGIGFSEGGSIKSVTGGVKGVDSVPARLMRGELVVDRSTATKLRDFLDKPQQPQNNENNEILLGQIVNLLQRPMTVQSQVSVNENAFADIILNLNRTGQRLA